MAVALMAGARLQSKCVGVGAGLGQGGSWPIRAGGFVRCGDREAELAHHVVPTAAGGGWDIILDGRIVQSNALVEKARREVYSVSRSKSDAFTSLFQAFY